MTVDPDTGGAHNSVQCAQNYRRPWPAVEPPEAACRWCHAPTYALAIRECSRCWELRTRIEHAPERALQMLKALAPEVLADGS
jgi:hypothetical protein